jgi:DNA-directed RNA polymerase subunit E'/Rpb7
MYSPLKPQRYIVVKFAVKVWFNALLFIPFNNEISCLQKC